MRLIAIIPARSGSKGLPDKNIRDLYGKPLLAYTIEAALRTKKFAEIMVSTDSDHYAKIAEKYGARVPFLRSTENSNDNASTWDAVYEVIKNYERINIKFDAFMLLQPTSPLRDEKDIIGAIDEYVEKKANTVVSVCEAEHTPIYTNTLPDSLSMDGFFGEHKWTRRQDLPTYYRLNGAIYMSDTKSFMKYRDIYRDNCFAFVMDNKKSVDIDTELDFMYVESILQKCGGSL